MRTQVTSVAVVQLLIIITGGGLISASLQAAAEGNRCPVASKICNAQNQVQNGAGEGATSFVQLPASPLHYPDPKAGRILSFIPKKTDDGFSIYNVDFKPGQFACSKCDTSTCPSCNVVCELSSCSQIKFYQKECWCRRRSDVSLRTPLWRLRAGNGDGQFVADSSVHKAFCNEQCGGGVCDLDGLDCQPYETACRPWWWCNLNPPSKKPAQDSWAGLSGEEYTTSFLQLPPATSSSSSFLQKSTATSSSSSSGLSSSRMFGAREFETNDMAQFSFDTGGWACSEAAYPPQIKNPTTYLYEERGYIVFPKESCSGAAYTHKCYCWDESARASGGDPMTSETMCDSACGLGECALKQKCAASLPPAYVPPKELIPDPVVAELRRASEVRTTQVRSKQHGNA